MFKKFIREMIQAAGDDEALERILYRADGVDMMYQREKLSWNDHEILFDLAAKLSSDLHR